MACAKGQKFMEKVDFKEKTTAARDFGRLYNELFIYEKRSGCGEICILVRLIIRQILFSIFHIKTAKCLNDVPNSNQK